MQKRELDLRSADEVVAEIDRLLAGGYDRAGSWTLTQICDHLEKTMNGGMKGFGFRMPWILRATVGKYLMRRILRTRRMGRMPAPKAVVPKPVDAAADDEAPVRRCQDCVRRAAEFAGPLPPHPAVDKLSLDDWKNLMWIHASHHLGFLIPRK
jgi:hypothetical protein